MVSDDVDVVVDDDGDDAVCSFPGLETLAAKAD